MPVARARLFDELTVQQLVEELASKWNDDESGVLACLADLLDADSRQRGYKKKSVVAMGPMGGNGKFAKKKTKVIKKKKRV